MSCERLNFYYPQDGLVMRTKIKDDKFIIKIQQMLAAEVEFPLDRNQAHLLKLWLEEHLK